MNPRLLLALWVLLAGNMLQGAGAADHSPRYTNVVNVAVPHISTDKSVRYDYDIVYVRAPRAGDKVHKRFYTDFSQPVTMEPGADLMLLHPDGREELLVAGGDGSITDPMMSFDAEWVYYVRLNNLQKASQWSPPRQGADIFKIHLKTRRVVKLTDQTFTPNTGAAKWSDDFRTPRDGRTHYDYGVFNMGPCPLPGGRIVFTSNRDGFKPSKGYPAIALQLFVMDDSDDGLGRNIEKIGHLNVAGALHPVVLTDGRIMFSTLESQGLRSDILWGLWAINPDGTGWAPLMSAFDHGGAPNGFHFQTQLSDGALIVEEYYNQNNSGFGAYIKFPSKYAYGEPAFGPAHMASNKPWRYGRHYNAKPNWYQMPFMPLGSVSLTPFSHGLEGPADPSVVGDKKSPAVGKFTHPSGAPDNHLLTIYSPGPVNHQYTYLPQLDGGIYLMKDGAVIEEPARMLLIKNDPNYNESWPRAVVSYERIYGMKEPTRLPPLANDGSLSKHLPEGTPFGLVGTSSLYKRESYPNGKVPEGQVTATYAGGNNPWRGLDAFTSHGNGPPLNFHNQGADVGLYENSDIHAVRILAMEPTTDRHRGANTGRRFYNHASERLRILGEIPVRKFDAAAVRTSSSPSPQPSPSGRGSDALRVSAARESATIRDAARLQETRESVSLSPGERAGVRGKEATELSKRANLIDDQPTDPDGNPDTSFLAKIPADTAFTFQTLDKRGMVLNTAQTWHQLRPGEIRNNCGGCHAHSQKPTDFAQTLAAKPDYNMWDLVNKRPLLTTKRSDESKQRWEAESQAGLKFAKTEVVNVEYWRDVRPILQRSCVPCHTSKSVAADVRRLPSNPEADQSLLTSAAANAAGNLDLDADDQLVQREQQGKFPGTYYRLALDEGAKFGYKPIGYDSWGYPNASRYIRKMQSRRSLLVWKIFGERLDGFSNDDHPSEPEPGVGYYAHKGERAPTDKNRARYDLDFLGSQMPPLAAVTGTYTNAAGQRIKVEPLTDEDRFTIVRWIDLGCPIDLDYDHAHSDARGFGWMLDDNRPILTLTSPRTGANTSLDRILIGMHDYYTGLAPESFTVTADFAVNGVKPGENIAPKFRPLSQGVWELKLTKPLKDLPRATIVVAVKDKQGNLSRIERTFTVQPASRGPRLRADR